MRLSDFAPRINNLGVSGIGDTSCPSGYVLYGPTNTCTQTAEYRLQAVLQQYLTAAQLGQYGDPPPSASDMAAMLAREAANICAESFIPCDSSVQALVDSAVQGYSAWLATYTPGSLFYAQPPPQPTPNVLNNTAPVPVYVPVTQPVNNVLTPPQPLPPVTAGQVVNNQTQGGSTAIANGTSGSNTGTSTGAFDWLTKPISDSIPIPLWGAIAGGVVALLVLKD